MIKRLAICVIILLKLFLAITTMPVKAAMVVVLVPYQWFGEFSLWFVSGKSTSTEKLNQEVDFLYAVLFWPFTGI